VKRTLLRVRLPALAVFLLLILAACAGGNSGRSDTAPETGSPPAAAPPETASPETTPPENDGLSGTYIPEDSGDPVLIFSGDKVTMMADIGLGEELELIATYEISGNTISFIFSKSDLKISLSNSAFGETIQSGMDELVDMMKDELDDAFADSPFSQNGDRIEIDDSVYIKQ